jgi:hypothetical protein
MSTTSEKLYANRTDYGVSLALLLVGTVLVALAEPGGEFIGQTGSWIRTFALFVLTPLIAYVIDIRIDTIDNAAREARELWHSRLIIAFLVLLALVLLGIWILGFLPISGLGVPTIDAQTAKFGLGVCLVLIGMMWPAVCTLQAIKNWRDSNQL